MDLTAGDDAGVIVVVAIRFNADITAGSKLAIKVAAGFDRGDVSGGGETGIESSVGIGAGILAGRVVAPQIAASVGVQIFAGGGVGVDVALAQKDRVRARVDAAMLLRSILPLLPGNDALRRRRKQLSP